MEYTMPDGGHSDLRCQRIALGPPGAAYVSATLRFGESLRISRMVGEAYWPEATAEAIVPAGITPERALRLNKGELYCDIGADHQGTWASEDEWASEGKMLQAVSDGLVEFLSLWVRAQPQRLLLFEDSMADA